MTGKEDGLYVVERVQRMVYAMCKLGEWVTMDRIDRLRKIVVNLHKGVQPGTEPVYAEGAWWQNAALPGISLSHRPSVPPKKVPRLSASRPGSLVASSKQLSVLHPEPAGLVETQVVDDMLSEPKDLALTVDNDVYATLVANYLRTLYLEKTPLAYFAKGPMSRARALFTNPDLAASMALAPWQLAAALRAYIITASAADKKYRDKLPELLRDLPTRVDEDGDITKKKKKRRKKKLKLDKHGMFPDESEYFAQWWQNDDALGSSEESAEQVLKRRSGQLRTRETFLQVILILEIMAIEMIQDAQDKVVSTTELAVKGEHKTEAESALEADKAEWAKTRKSRDLMVHLELLLDKLCIWHSLDHDFGTDEAKSKKESGKETPDELRNFCVEVIIPFYASRVPEQAAITNKKLGGPTASKPKSRPRKPGEPEERSRPDKKPRKPLSRVATETNYTTTKPVPSIPRSATDSLTIPNLKRESSEIPLDLIPRLSNQTSNQASNSRRSANILEKMRFKQREVDLNAMSAANEAKLKKKAEVEEKLREAITALKKPNRALAGKEIVEEQRGVGDRARQRGSGAQSQSQRQKQKERERESVQVSATPKVGRRTKDMIAATPQKGYGSIPQPFFPSSGTSMVPSSSMRPPPGLGLPGTVEAVPQTGHRERHVAIEETPSRGPAKFAVPTVPGSVIRQPDFSQGKMEPVFATPSKSSRRDDGVGTPSKSVGRTIDAVVATPVKGGSETGEGTQGPVLDESGNEGNTIGKEPTDIYAALGWDDDFDDA